MARSRRNGVQRGSLLRFLGRFVLLIGFGFGIGLVIGLATEEPDLLYGHLSGDSESVVFIEEEPIVEAPYAIPEAIPEVTPDAAPDPNRTAARLANSETRNGSGAVQRAGGLERGEQARDRSGHSQSAAAAPATQRAAEAPKVLPAVAARPPAKKAPDVVSAGSGPADDRWAIQVGAFADEAAAQRLVQTLEAKDYPVEVVGSSGSNKRWRVRVQPVQGEDRARGLAGRLKRDERLPTWVIRLEPETQP